MTGINPRLNVPQSEFLALPHKYRAMVCGFGTGKTWGGSAAIAKHVWEWPRINSGYFAPTFPHIRDIFYPTIEEVAFDWGLRVEIREGNKEVHYYSGKRYRSTTICRSMDNPGNIVGFKIGHALLDEFDLLALQKALLAWRKVQARMRYNVSGLRNGIDIATTPEGFKATYQLFVKAVRDNPKLASSYGLVHGSTYQNEKNLPDDYIQSLLDSYPPQLISAYLRGQFVNLNSGSVYPNFDRKLNHTSEQIKEHEPLHVGMDFNVNRMAAVIHVVRDGKPLALGELTKLPDTPAMINALQERYKGHHITVYPDASGNSRKTVNSTETDHTLLRAAKFTLLTNPANPAIRDRVMSMNAMFCNAAGDRRYKVNTDLCPVYTELLERQAYDTNGMPEKDGTEDPVDAGGYFIAHRYAIAQRIATAMKLSGL